MSKRTDVRGASDASFRYRCKKEELEADHAMAEYLETDLSSLIRALLKEKRRQLNAEGKRPPLRRRNGDKS